MPGYAPEPETADDGAAYADVYAARPDAQPRPNYHDGYDGGPTAHAYDQDRVLVPVSADGMTPPPAQPEAAYDGGQEVVSDYRMYSMPHQRQLNRDGHHSPPEARHPHHSTAMHHYHYPHHHNSTTNHHHAFHHRPTRPRASKRKRVITFDQRKAANIRERRRMLSLNDAFDLLRRSLPTFSYEKKLSRIETLRLALTYMAFMMDIVNGADPKEVRLLPTRPAAAAVYRRPAPPGGSRGGEDGGNATYMYYV